MSASTRRDLLGCWRTDPEDHNSIEELGDVVLCFLPDGLLEYVVLGQEKDEVILLRYCVEGDELVTDQPSAPRKERSRFRIIGNNQLLIEYDGLCARYVRQNGRQHPAHVQ